MVDVYADPDLSGLEVGQSAALARLGSTTTGEDGCFQVPSSARWAALASGGTLDLRVFIRRPDQLEFRVVPVGVTAATSGAPKVTVPIESKASRPVPTLQTFTGAETVTAPYAAMSTGSTGSPQRVPAVATTAPASAFVDGSRVAERSGGTRWTLLQDFGNRPVLVGQWWSTTPGVWQRWSYTKGATSALGGAFTLSGEGGEYKHSETQSTTTTATVGFPVAEHLAGKYYRTYFRYGKYKLEEYEYTTGQWYYIGTWVRRTSWERGTQVTSGVPVPSTQNKNCSKYFAGSDDTSEVSKAVTWTDGVKLSVAMKGVLGSVSLSSQTGFTTQATNEVHFTRKGRLCGVSGPLSRPGALVARKPLSR